MKKIIYSLIMVISLSLTSCNEYLDVKPVGKMIPTEVSQFENLLNYPYLIQYFMYDNNYGSFYATLGDNLKISPTLMEYFYNETCPNLDILAAYIFYTPIQRANNTPPTWIYSYRNIGYFNNVVDGVSAIDQESDYAKGVMAEARAGRAWLYMYLALTYGPMYNPSGANDTPVVPLRISGDPTVDNGPLATTEELFNQVKEDLDYACEYCPISTHNPTRINKAGAYALRAEYHMFKRDWAAMLSDSRTAWQLALQDKGSVDNLIYDFKDFYYVATTAINVQPGVSPETAMNFRGPDNDFDKSSSRENLIYRTAPSNYGTGRYYPADDWLAIFDQKSDMRWPLFALTAPGYSRAVGGVTYSDGITQLYFRGQHLSVTESVTYPLLLLTKAEAEARNNNLSTALSDLNTLRRYRYDYGTGQSTDLTGGSSMSQDQLLNEILTERRREQPLVSFQRTVDLKRYVYDSGKPWSKSVITHTCGDKTYSKPITDPIFQSIPFDDAVLGYNPQWGIPLSDIPFDPVSAK